MTPGLLSPPSRARVAPAVLAALIAVLLAAALAAVVVRRTDDRGPTQPPAATQATSAPRPEEPGPSPSDGVADAPPSPSPSSLLPHVPPSQRRDLEQLMNQVAEIRGLPWKEPLQLRVVPRDEMVRRLRAANARDADPAQLAAEEATLKLLGLIPPTLDYGRLLDDLLRGAVLGFYDPQTKDLFVAVRDVNALEVAERSTIVHEMVHALTDQHFGFGPRTLALEKADKAEEYLAFSALLEGDARLTELAWMAKHVSEIEALAVLFGVGADVEEGVDVLSRTPRYVQESLFFPYRTGRDFVERLHSTGGFAAVDAAYRRPPASTEHILHPETYATKQNATPPPLPDVAAKARCRRVRAGSLGEFDMKALLSPHAAGADAAVQGWNGDAYSLLRCGSTHALVDRWQTDSVADAGQLVEALGRWARVWSGGPGPGADGRFTGPSGSGRFVQSGARVDIVLAQDAATADRLARAFV